MADTQELTNQTALLREILAELKSLNVKVAAVQSDVVDIKRKPR